MKEIIINGESLTLEQLVLVSVEQALVVIDPTALCQVQKARDYVERLVLDKQSVYGVTTGFGHLCHITISESDIDQLQINLIRSHATGVGQPFDKVSTRAILLLRANTLLKGHSGVRIEVIQLLVDLLNNHIHPVIPQKGSLGASGDLAPLSHLALTLVGEGTCEFSGQIVDSKTALVAANLKPLTLKAKEGLALINGTQVLTAVGALTVYYARQLVVLADLIGALSFEALGGLMDALDPKIHQVRGQSGQIASAEVISIFLAQSENVSHDKSIKVQDPYSLRCMPVIHGASKDAIDYVYSKVNLELNAVTDNPLIFVIEDQVLSGGNFHGQPMALVFDFLAIALAELANASERRIERLVNPALSDHPAFLVKQPGLNSGFMIMQYTAAALVSENKILAHPASVDSIPSSGNQEDHVSMGTIAARKAMEILDNVQHVLAIEWLSAAQAMDLKVQKRMGDGTKIAYDLLRKHIAMVDQDRYMQPDILKAVQLIKDQTLYKSIKRHLRIAKGG